eukprot:4917038-Amphidinium_carterae.1
MTAFKQSCQFWRASKFTAWIVASSWLLALGDQPNATPSHLLPPSVIFLLLDDLGFNNVPWNEGVPMIAATWLQYVWEQASSL